MIAVAKWSGEARAKSQELRAVFLNSHRSHFFFHLGGIHHDDRVPRTAVQEAAVGTFAEAFLATDAKNGIDLDAPKRRMVFVGHPEHAVFHRTILDASGRTGASGATLGNHRQFLRLLLPRSGETFRLRFKLLLVGNHADGFGGAGCRRHGGDYTLNSALPKTILRFCFVTLSTVSTGFILL